MSKQRLAFLIAAAVGILGTFLPWVGSMSGMQGNGAGKIIIFFFAIIAVLAYLGDRATDLKGWKFWTAFGLALLMGLLGLKYLSDASTLGASAGIGLILIPIAGMGAAVSALALKSKA